MRPVGQLETGGRNVAMRAATPSGFWIATRSANTYDSEATIETGLDAFDASSIRDASAPSVPSAVE